jgi:hypothetical protein
MRIVAVLVMTIVFPMTLTACSDSRPVGIMVAELSSGGRVLYVEFNACNSNSHLIVKEAARAVTVTVMTDAAADGDDCVDREVVPLRAPLGGRRVIDGATGRVVEVATKPCTVMITCK